MVNAADLIAKAKAAGMPVRVFPRTNLWIEVSIDHPLVCKVIGGRLATSTIWLVNDLGWIDLDGLEVDLREDELKWLADQDDWANDECGKFREADPSWR